MPDSQLVVGTPPPHLRPLVPRWTGYHVRGPAGVHHGVPSRSMTVVIALDGTVDLLLPRRSRTAVTGGLRSRPVLVEHGELQHGLQLELTPLGARALFGVPAGELAETVADLDDVLGPAAGELLDRLGSATSWADRFAQLTGVLERLVRPAELPSAELALAWRRLAATDGAVPVRELAEETGWSRQHLRTRFRREFGLSPKLAARVMRFERARRLVAVAPRRRLADIAAECGYADQAHLNRDWREFCGATPSEWISTDLPFVQGAQEPETTS
ncbi:AraC family transcriptional regulator [Saccharopolyspora rosea]|uniref:Helix-turn-helix domain-containing protein n=1 Tax=Saccharopolyspora rosea TaxID=524884 RepID=A0ABW3FV32_9PSEU|nr:AraC family transcriptional regulator [Saccharopolyspora rosea]